MMCCKQCAFRNNKCELKPHKEKYTDNEVIKYCFDNIPCRNPNCKKCGTTHSISECIL